MRASPGGGLRLGCLRPGRPGPWLPFDTYKRPKRDETEWQRLAMQSVATNCTLKRNECLYLCRSVATDSAGCSATLITTRKGRGCGVPARWLHCCGVIAHWLHCCGVPARCACLERAEAPCQRAGRVKAPRWREERCGRVDLTRMSRLSMTIFVKRPARGDGLCDASSYRGHPVRLHPRAPRLGRPGLRAYPTSCSHPSFRIDCPLISSLCR